MFSLPPGTEMFQFPGCPRADLCIQSAVTGDESRRVSPFGNPGVKRLLTASPGFSQPSASFFGTTRLGIHLVPFCACRVRHDDISLLRFFTCESTAPTKWGCQPLTAEE
jgi:hypothetical protein